MFFKSNKSNIPNAANAKDTEAYIEERLKGLGNKDIQKIGLRQEGK